MAMAAMNPAQMIQGAVGVLTSVFDLFNSRDRKANEPLRNTLLPSEVEQRLQNALEHAVDKALGRSV